MAKNKFSKPPFLHEYDELALVKLSHLLRALEEVFPIEIGRKGSLLIRIDQITSRSASIRKVDLPFLNEIIDASNTLKKRGFL